MLFIVKRLQPPQGKGLNACRPPTRQRLQALGKLGLWGAFKGLSCPGTRGCSSFLKIIITGTKGPDRSFPISVWLKRVSGGR